MNAIEETFGPVATPCICDGKIKRIASIFRTDKRRAGMVGPQANFLPME